MAAGQGSGAAPLFRQLPLDLGFNVANTLPAFEPGRNQLALEALQQAVNRLRLPHPPAHRLWLWGEPDSGRSHLLKGACHELAASGHRAMYLHPQSTGAGLAAAVADLETCLLVAIDDVHRLAGDPQSELALFTLCHTLQSAGALLLVAADQPPARSGWHLSTLR